MTYLEELYEYWNQKYKKLRDLYYSSEYGNPLVSSDMLMAETFKNKIFEEIVRLKRLETKGVIDNKGNWIS